MRKALVFLAAAVLVLSACGCGDKVSAEAREQLKQANAHLSVFKKQMDSLADFSEKWEKLISGGVSTQAYAEARKLLDTAQKSIETSLKELREAESALVGVRNMDISAEMEKYLGMKVDALEEYQKWMMAELQAMPLRFQVVDMNESGASFVEITEVETSINELEKQAREHAIKAGALQRDANDYYDEQKLGK